MQECIWSTPNAYFYPRNWPLYEPGKRAQVRKVMDYVNRNSPSFFFLSCNVTSFVMSIQHFAALIRFILMILCTQITMLAGTASVFISVSRSVHLFLLHPHSKVYIQWMFERSVMIGCWFYLYVKELCLFASFLC